MDHYRIFKGYLERRHLKFTPERKSILEAIFSLHGHFDVELLYRHLEGRGGGISRATLYRTLPLLIDSGLVKEVLRSQNKSHYEHIFGHPHHDHLLCIKCGKIVEFKDDEIERIQDEICERFEFKPLEHRLGIMGYCKECRGLE
jgi:Fur family ferric uptake transcriptional regulator